MGPPVETHDARDGSSVTVVINGKKYNVPTTYSDVSLNDYLRDHLGLTGTKVMCREGGCGVCIVHAAYPDTAGSGQIVQRSINSCLCPILSCDGWEITTVEGIGDQNKPHVIQSRLTEHYGTQCGYCTSGWVMTMYSLVQNAPEGQLTKQLVENGFDGNICRCTGYRPILDAFKSFAKSDSDEDAKNCLDIEDHRTPPCVKSRHCPGRCGNGHQTQVEVCSLPKTITENAFPWYKPTSLNEAYQLIKTNPGTSFYYVVGHTGIGVYDDPFYTAYMDMKGIKDLYKVDKTDNLVSIGANLPLRDVIEVFRKYRDAPGFQHLPALAEIISKTAHVSVRNVGSWGGNLAMIHADATETFLTGKNIADAAILQQALKTLANEIKPVDVPAEASPKYKTSLSCCLFYKFVLEIVGDYADPVFRSAVGNIARPLSSGTQAFDTKQEEWPLTQPIPKIESLAQCTGEAKYISDAFGSHILHAAFVLTTTANATIFRVDTASALALSGVRQVFTAADIPGKNNVSPPATLGPTDPEELFASKQSSYAGQPVALVVADTKAVAEAGAKLVKVTYSNVKTPILSCQDAISQKSFHGQMQSIIVGDPDKALAQAPNKINGELEIGAQAHYHMETMVSVAYPEEDGVSLDVGTQWIDGVQTAVSQCLAIKKHKVNISVKRCGGGFGAKIFRTNHISAATAVAAFLLKKPVKMHMSLWDNSRTIGKRFPYYGKYQVGFDKTGKLLSVICDVYSNTGAFNAGAAIGGWKARGDNAYFCSAWKFNLFNCKTNVAPNTACRAPGSTEAIYFIEYMMEHISKVLQKPSIEVKMLNFVKNGDKLLDGSTIKDCNIKAITEQLLQTSSYSERLNTVKQFNKENRWRKRGINVVPMRYSCSWARRQINCLLAVYHGDGTVAVTHGGVEIGQGINTKVAQVVAYELGIDMKYIAIKANASLTDANGTPTGGSITSEIACMAAISCCDQLKALMKPVKDSMKSPTWEQLVEECNSRGVDLTARALAAPHPPGPTVYNTYGAMCTEVELDGLTGQYQINRLDVLYDCGESMSPLIDVGQIEGAVIMGLGYFTSEEIIFDKKTGSNLTFGTWKYKPPTTKDIPVDFRITMLKNAPNPSGVLRSKIVAEPPLCMSASVVFALQNAIFAHLNETQKDDWFRIDAPVTVERTQQYCRIENEQMLLKK
ncbi:uncharacterized protein LOC129595632 [Paramacrobiotus metropolitanus]|uniref:uncharacterized protein LOC129595632 n=1 Tax=Paramacrobiotus metropolitanus TaxID=2943436 RepID=UPI0024459737|nr:uncharacterized protein LOC129595632 [Paramacrobiotus metropolitanus]